MMDSTVPQEQRAQLALMVRKDLTEPQEPLARLVSLALLAILARPAQLELPGLLAQPVPMDSMGQQERLEQQAQLELPGLTGSTA